jgi:hypothetical protein
MRNDQENLKLLASISGFSRISCFISAASRKGNDDAITS